VCVEYLCNIPRARGAGFYTYMYLYDEIAAQLFFHDAKCSECEQKYKKSDPEFTLEYFLFICFQNCYLHIIHTSALLLCWMFNILINSLVLLKKKNYKIKLHSCLIFKISPKFKLSSDAAQNNIILRLLFILSVLPKFLL